MVMPLIPKRPTLLVQRFLKREGKLRRPRPMRQGPSELLGHAVQTWLWRSLGLGRKVIIPQHRETGLSKHSLP